MNASPSSPPAWSPDPDLFLADVEAKPAALERLAQDDDVTAAVAAVEALARGLRRVLFLGMGSSRYAAQDAARRLRAAGLDAVAEWASAEALPPPTTDTLVIGISASGTSAETVEALHRYAGASPVVAMTEHVEAPLTAGADVIVPLAAGAQAGGVDCRSFLHTGLILRRIEAGLIGAAFDFDAACGAVASATADLLDRRGSWLEAAAELLDSPDGVHIIGPAERWSAVAQSALMYLEGPRRPATASETGDWCHVDVYLTKSTDYRALLLRGSRYDAAAMEWLQGRGSRVLAVGQPLPGAEASIDYPGASDPLVAAHTDPVISELVAAHWWQQT